MSLPGGLKRCVIGNRGVQSYQRQYRCPKACRQAGVDRTPSPAAGRHRLRDLNSAAGRLAFVALVPATTTTALLPPSTPAVFPRLRRLASYSDQFVTFILPMRWRRKALFLESALARRSCFHQTRSIDHNRGYGHQCRSKLISVVTYFAAICPQRYTAIRAKAPFGTNRQNSSYSGAYYPMRVLLRTEAVDAFSEIGGDALLLDVAANSLRRSTGW